ncbi:hypothetical protein O9993_06115 [Vibrio lentus]|nr:hypothetical protein [Vibrio lentus]
MIGIDGFRFVVAFYKDEIIDKTVTNLWYRHDWRLFDAGKTTNLGRMKADAFRK